MNILTRNNIHAHARSKFQNRLWAGRHRIPLHLKHQHYLVNMHRLNNAEFLLTIYFKQITMGPTADLCKLRFHRDTSIQNLCLMGFQHSLASLDLDFLQGQATKTKSLLWNAYPTTWTKGKCFRLAVTRTADVLNFSFKLPTKSFTRLSAIFVPTKPKNSCI